MAPEEWAHRRADAEKVLAKSAGTRPVQAEHYGVAAGLLASAGQDDQAREAIRLLVYGPRYKGEALRRFADGIRTGQQLYAAVTENVKDDVDPTWREQADGAE